MTDYVWPNGVRISSCDWRPISNSRYTPDTFSGGQQTATRPGDKMGCRVRVINSSGAERAKLRALVHALRGRGNRCFLPDLAFQRRGSFPSSELFSNSDFSNGVTGWVGINSNLSVSDNVLTVAASGAGANPLARQTAALAINAPHCIRSLITPGRTFANGALSFGVEIADTVSTVDTFSAAGGYLVASMVAENASVATHYAAVVQSTTGYQAGDSLRVRFTSLSRCALVDGAPNLLLQSETFSNAAWTKVRSSIGGAATAPDLTATGATLVEDSSNNTHYVTQSVTGLSATAGDYALTVCARSGGRNFIALTIDEATGGTSVSQYFNLATGAVGATGATGANWSSRRAFIADLGNGWYACTLIGRKTNAATQIGSTIALASADGTGSYLGNGTSSVSIWRATLSQSGVPSRLRSTTTTAAAAQSQTGSALNVKGLPPSTAGLLKQGDPVEINKILYPLEADLDSDASGLGYLQLPYPPPRGIADNTPVIVTRPLSRMILMNDPEIPCVPGGNGGANNFSDFEFDFVQDLAA